MKSFLVTLSGTPAAVMAVLVIVALVGVEVARVSERLPAPTLRRWYRGLVPLAVVLLFVALSRPVVLG